MREMGDDHGSPNIDVEHVGARGHVLPANHCRGLWFGASEAWARWLTRLKTELDGVEPA